MLGGLPLTVRNSFFPSKVMSLQLHTIKARKHLFAPCSVNRLQKRIAVVAIRTREDLNKKTPP